MLINIVYSIFFLLVNFVLFSLLTKALKIDKPLQSILILSILVWSFLHTNFFGIEGLMKSEDFWDLMIFSLSLIISHFGGALILKVFRIFTTQSTPKGIQFQE